MARVVAVFDDLLLGSNVLGMLRAGGYEAALSGADAHPDGADALIVDLASTGFDGVALVERLRAAGELEGTRTLGVYSHVDADTKRRADAAGFDLVVPRSRMAREGAALVERLLVTGSLTGPTWSKSNARSTSTSRAGQQPPAAARPGARAPAVNEGETASSCAASSARSARARLEQRRHRAVGLHLGLRVAALQRADRGAHQRPAVLERRPGHAQHRATRPLQDRVDADDVGAALAGAGEVADVEDREVGAAVAQLRDGGAGPPHLERHALGLVVAALRRQVDPGVHGVGRGVQQQRRVLVRAVVARGAAAAGDEKPARSGDESRAHPGMVATRWPAASPSRAT